MEFVGRDRELATLDGLLNETRSGQGVLVSMRGRRQVGKSRLVSEFVERAGVPSVYFTASRQPATVELGLFAQAAVAGGIDDAGRVIEAGARTWEVALDLVTATATPQRPVIVVIDEFPYLIQSEPTIEAIVQKVWRTLERRAVLVILIGSDLSMMQALTEYDRPLFGRARETRVDPLTVADVADLRDLDATNAFDAYLITGGLPRLAARWRRSDSVKSYLRRELADETSPLAVLGERTLTAEFPADTMARPLLTAIGSGERSHGAIMSRSGVGRGSIDPALKVLADKGLVTRELAYAEPPGLKNPRYAIADPYLRFWLAFVQTSIELVARGRVELALARIEESWSAYRGHAIEPLVRASVERLLPDAQFGEAHFVGSYWTRDNRVQVDLVGGREPARAGVVDFVGSIKWRERGPFDGADAAALAAARPLVPGADGKTKLVGVSRSGFATSALDVALGPEELLAAWR